MVKIRDYGTLVVNLLPYLRTMLVATAIAVSAPAAALQICVEEQPLIPLTNAGKEPQGYAEILVKDAARTLGIAVEEVVAPWERCQKMMFSGVYDAVLNMTYAGKNKTLGAFPMTQTGTPDTTKAAGLYISYLFRRVGSTADLIDGKIVNTAKPVAIQAGYQLHRDLVQGMGLTVVEIPNSAKQMADMLAAGRVDLVAGDYAMQREVETKYKTILEPLPTPLNGSFVYLVFSRKYYEANRETAERFWTEMARIRHSPDYETEISTIDFGR